MTFSFVGVLVTLLSLSGVDTSCLDPQIRKSAVQDAPLPPVGGESLPWELAPYSFDTSWYNETSGEGFTAPRSPFQAKPSVAQQCASPIISELT